MSPTLKYTISLLRKYLKPYVGQVVLLGFLLVLYNGIQIANPQVIRFYIDAVFAETLDTKAILIASLIYIGFSLIHRAAYVVIRYFSQKLAWATTNDLRVDLTNHCMNLDMTFHNQYKTGEMIERIDGDASSLSEFFSTFSIYFFGSLILLIGVLTAVFIEKWVYGVLFLGFAFLALIAFYFVRNVSSPLWKKARESTTALFGHIEESVSGLEDIKGNGADEFLMKRFHEVSQTDFKNKNKAMIVSRTYYAINVTMRAILNIGILVVSHYLAAFLDTDAGVIYLLLTYGTNLLWPLRLLLWQIEQLQNSLANIERINEFFQIETKIIDDGETEFPEGKVNLSFDNLDFGYSEDLVLKDISFNLEPGRTIGLVGQTGSGKTTLARLVFRLYDPRSGKIRVNGINTKNFPLKELRSNVAYVTQDVELFKASVRDNVTFFDKEIPEEIILDIFKDIGLEKWCNNLPNGLETIIFSEECGLSAGEEQLLALTRAFLKDPKIVILDEASSRLDPATERQIEIALEKLLQGRSAIIIAHRLTTLYKVDDILILGNGEIMEYGSREELAKNPKSQFSILLQKGIEEVLT
ncbi:MAG: ABC transporter ATP-binding protein [Candidatus Heimdallarchaeota archaeon]|nr:ABC transporter ATP-binding protein [Candidatus Heimdallarchaeota archaeon]MBY8993843.1 ABC transporter ATP-binding protein [Candidatus Heimdallarchaeota archaeon]